MSLKKKIGLGTVQFGMDYGISNVNGKTSKNEVESILNFAQQQGINTLDTALAYGTSEGVLGSVGVRNFKVISKFLPHNEVNSTVTQQLESSLKKLKAGILYAFLAHKPQDVLKNPNQWEELISLKKSEKINKIGLSLNEPEELEEALKRKIIPEIIQIPYNYFDRRFEELMKMLHDRGCEIHARSAFLQGLFFRKPEGLPNYFNPVKQFLCEVRYSTDNLAGSLLKFSLRKDYIDKVILGVETKNQLEENLDSLNICKALPDKQYNISDSILMPSNWP